MKNSIKKMAHKTPLHYSYHAKSYSKQARELSNIVINNINSGYWCIEQAFRIFYLSYRHPIVRFRALNRFKRYVREGKVHEKSTAIKNWQLYKNNYSIQ